MDQETIQKNKNTILSILGNVQREGIESLIEFLENSDFFTAPASTKYHGSYEGGLAEHSLHVRYVLQDKNKYYQLNLPQETIDITGLLHDICKIDFYKKGIKNVKDGKRINGYGKEVDKWIEKKVWECKEAFPIGHGEKSVIQIMKYIKLTDQEIAMIRWHMGGYESKDNYRSLNNAVEMYPEIIAIHAADLEASNLISTVRGGKQ